MKLKIAVAAMAVSIAAAAGAMPVQMFLTKADALKAKGPFALFSGDLKLLTNEVKSDFGQILSEREAAKAAHRPTAFCPPAGSIRMTDKDIMGAMLAVPAAQRARTETRDALRGYFIRRFPCRT